MELTNGLRSYRREESVVFRKTNEEFGGLSNMAPGFPLRIGHTQILTSEALYQACRFPHDLGIQRLIIGARSPMTAKMKSKPHRSRSRPDWDGVRVEVMRWCLRVKLAQNWRDFAELLLATGERPIVEESRKDAFWGARSTPDDDQVLVGKNVLGRLLMELRDELKRKGEELKRVEPPTIPDFLFFGEPIPPVCGQTESAARDSGLVLFGETDSDPQGSLGTPRVESSPGAVHLESTKHATGRGQSAESRVAYRKKLIEVALPLEAINRESQHEKSVPRKGHPATMHLWWARRPLAACRAVLFASIVDDPSSRPDLFPTESDQDLERERLFRIIERLVRWENSSNEDVLNEARAEIASATDGNPPAILDPFSGGGSIPLEAQRLGLETYASDLNPVAALITEALVQTPLGFAGRAPVNPAARQKLAHTASWDGAQGLADDVRYYGARIRQRVRDEISDAYPKIEAEGLGAIDVTGWLWARTAPCPNPACGGTTPLVRSFALSTRRGSEARIEPSIDRVEKTVSFTVHRDPETPYPGLKIGRGANFRCIFCDQMLTADYVKEVGKTSGYGLRLLAVIGEGVRRRRTYLSPTSEQEATGLSATPEWEPDTPLPDQALGFRVQGYGFIRQADLYTSRQLLSLTKFVDETRGAHEEILRDATAAGVDDAERYATAVVTYLSFAISKLADWCNGFCTFIPSTEQVGHLFSEQKISMVWDFLETNPLSQSVGNYGNHVEWVARTVEALPAQTPAHVRQVDARHVSKVVPEGVLVATDPPYDDNIGYADLSDFFYTWLRPVLSPFHGDLFATVLTPKREEIIAASHLHAGNENAARAAFQEGLHQAFSELVKMQASSYPATIVYGLRQEEGRTRDGGRAISGWEAFLEAVMSAGFAITGTWPVRSERRARSRAIEANALASSIVLVCRPRDVDAPITTRREFLGVLRAELPIAVRTLQRENTAPVDLAQAAIGPGMAIFTRYAKVVEAEGQPMDVRTALGLINSVLDEILTEQEGDFDTDTRFAVAWFEEHGMAEAAYGEADVLARAKNTSVQGLKEAGILDSSAGKVRLLSRGELPDAWDPSADRRLTVWEITQHLIRRLELGGESAAAELVRPVGGLGEVARELAYRLYTISERKGWAQDALGYNALVVSWPEIGRLATEQPIGLEQQTLGV